MPPARKVACHRLSQDGILIARMSDKRHHYMGCGETYYLMGEAFGKALLEMMK